jgi:hypothetical protein
VKDKGDKSFGKWRETGVEKQPHNHPLEDLQTLARSRKVSAAEEETFKSSVFVMQQRQIAAMIVKGRGENGPKLTTNDVNNWVKRVKKEERGDRSDIQALLDKLVEENVPHEYLKDDSGKLLALLFFPAKSLELSMKHQSVLLLDCTYKTNKYVFSF